MADTFTTKISYEILDEDGNVMDSITDHLNWPLTAEQSVLHKYLFMARVFGCDNGEDEPELMKMVRRVLDS